MAMQNRRNEEKGNLTDFLGDKCMNVKKPLNIKATIEEYMEASGTGFGFGALRKMADEYMKEVCSIRVFDRRTKVEQFFGLSVTVDRNTLKELREHAHVEVDKRGRITKYAAHDGSLNLLGCHVKNYRSLQNYTVQEEVEPEASVAPPAPKRPRVQDSTENAQTSSTPAVSQNAESTSSRSVPMESTRIEKENLNLLAMEPPSVKQEVPDEPSMERVIQPDVKPVVPQEQQPLLQPRQIPQISMERAPQTPILPLAKHKKALRYIKNMMEILNLNIPALETKIDRKIHLIENDQHLGTRNEEKLKIADFQNILMTSVSLAKPYACDVCEGETRNMREFILLINMGIRTLRMGEMDEIQKKVQEAMDDPECQYKVVPVEKMHMLVQIIVEILCGF